MPIQRTYWKPNGESAVGGIMGYPFTGPIYFKAWNGQWRYKRSEKHAAKPIEQTDLPGPIQMALMLLE